MSRPAVRGHGWPGRSWTRLALSFVLCVSWAWGVPPLGAQTTPVESHLAQLRAASNEALARGDSAAFMTTIGPEYRGTGGAGGQIGSRAALEVLISDLFRWWRGDDGTWRIHAEVFVTLGPSAPSSPPTPARRAPPPRGDRSGRR